MIYVRRGIRPLFFSRENLWRSFYFTWYEYNMEGENQTKRPSTMVKYTIRNIMKYYNKTFELEAKVGKKKFPKLQIFFEP